MDSNLFRNIFSIAKQYKWRFLRAFAMVSFSNALLILNPLIFRRAILSLEVQPATSVYSWAIILLSISLVAASFKYWMRVSFIEISRDVEQEVRSKLFAKIQSQSRVFYDRHGVGELLSRLTNDITAYRDVLGPGIMYPAFFTTLVVPGIAALFYISPMMAIISFIPLLIIPLLNLFVRNSLYSASLNVQGSLAEMSDIAHEYYSGIRVVKGYEIENEALSHFKVACQHFSKLNMYFVCIQGLFLPFLTLITRSLTVLLVLFAGAIILKSWSVLDTADFISFMLIQSYIFFPILMLGWILPVYERGRAAYSRLVEIYNEPVEVVGKAGSVLKIPPKADIVFSNLSFSYPNSQRKVLEHLSLTIQGGTFVGITGPVGSGKTTLFRLLSREYAVQRGVITIGGHDINDYDLEAFFQELVTVEQIPFLFSKTIAENILFGKTEASREELDVVIKQADLHETILEFPMQYDTVVGERGVSLSGGQKQRVAMARAFLVNRSILLLDDIFSAVDAETEKRIFDAMKENFKGKTILLITHRVSILSQLDRVIYLADGRVEEDGSPEELLRKNGYYAALAGLQGMS